MASSGSTASGEAPAPEDPGAAARAEAEALLALVRERYGSRLSPEELEAVRAGVEAVVARARALRAVPLRESDEPAPPFVPFRADP